MHTFVMVMGFLFIMLVSFRIIRFLFAFVVGLVVSLKIVRAVSQKLDQEGIK